MYEQRRAAGDVAREIMAAEEWTNANLGPGDIERILTGLQRDLDPKDPARLFLSSPGVLGAIAKRFQPTIGGIPNKKIGRPPAAVHAVVTHVLEQVDVVIHSSQIMPPLRAWRGGGCGDLRRSRHVASRRH